MNLAGKIKQAKTFVKIGKKLWNIILVVMTVVVVFQGVVWAYGKVKSLPINVQKWAYSDVESPPQQNKVLIQTTVPVQVVAQMPLTYTIASPTVSVGASRSIEALTKFSQTIGSIDPATIKSFISGGKEFNGFPEWFSYWTGNISLVKMAEALVKHDWSTASVEAALAVANEPSLGSLPNQVVEKLRSQEEIWARAKAKKEPTPSSFEIAQPKTSFSAVEQAQKVQQDSQRDNLTPIPTVEGPIDLVLNSARSNEVTKVETAGTDGVVITTKKGGTQLLQKGKDVLVVEGKGKPTIAYCIDCGDIKIAAVPAARATPDPTTVACLNDINCAGKNFSK